MREEVEQLVALAFTGLEQADIGEVEYQSGQSDRVRIQCGYLHQQITTIPVPCA